MILLDRPLMLLLAIPWAALCALLFVRQRQALKWIQENSAPRFHSVFSQYGPKTVILHGAFLFAMGLAGIAAAAAPYSSGLVEKTEASGDIAIVIDASFSMAARDVDNPVKEEAAETKSASKGAKPKKRAKKISRIKAAKDLATQVIASFPNSRFALLSFSGVAAIHSPATTDHAALTTYLKTLTLHSFQATGSSYAAAFSGLLHLTSEESRPFQVVLISDGELPQPDRFSDEISALKKKKVRIHTIGIGSKKGSRVTIYNPHDLRSKRTPARPAKTITTRRNDSELQKIADDTGGTFTVLDKLDPARFREALQAGMVEPAAVRAPGRRDLTRFPLGVFLLLFLTETVLLSGGGLPALRRIKALLLVGALASGGLSNTACGNDLNRAHIRNEQGIALFKLKRHEQARTEFEASAGLAVREEIPLFNEAGNLVAEKSFSAAHKKYEEVIERSPDLAAALYNDGHALYRWGQGELHPPKGEHCRQERTRKLWEQALIRFQRTAEHRGADSGLILRARKNAAFVSDQLKELDRFEKQCPPKPPSESQKKEEQPKEGQSPKQEQSKSENKSGKSSGSPQGGNGEPKPGKGEPEQNRDRNRGGNKTERNAGVAGGTKGLTREEQAQIDRELARIRGQARAGKKHLQSKAQQMPEGKLPGAPPGKGQGGKSKGQPKKGKGKGPPPIWW